MDIPRGPALTVDCVAFDPSGRLLLIRRKYPPFEGGFALPGGFVDLGETVEVACAREFFEESGLEAGALHLVGVYSDPDRDKRRHTVSVAYLTLIKAGKPSAGDDAALAQWTASWDDLSLAFDHARIIADAEHLRTRLIKKTNSI